jgi:hypothetical protein
MGVQDYLSTALLIICVLWVAYWGIGSIGTVRYRFHS